MNLFNHKREDYILEHTGICSVFEQCAEECCELGQVCLKMARKIRNQNPTPKRMNEIEKDFKEEVADVLVCLSVLIKSNNLTTFEELENIFDMKIKRWVERVRESETEKKHTEM